MKLTAIFLVLASAAILAAANQPLLGRPQHQAQSYAQRHQRFVLVRPQQHQQQQLRQQPAFFGRSFASTRSSSSSNVRPVAAPVITRSSASYQTLSSPPAAPVFTRSAASFQTFSSPPAAPLVQVAPLTSSTIGFQQEQSQQRQASSSSSAASAAFSSQQRSSNLIYVLDDDSGETSAEDGLFFRPPQRLIRAYDANTGRLVNTRAVPNF